MAAKPSPNTPAPNGAKPPEPDKKAANQKGDICFVLMPFGAPLGSYYQSIIMPAIVNAGLIPRRADDIFMPSPIVGDIWKLVQQAKVLVALLTNKNANVFYELGLAHALGKPVVLISETMADVPFDLRSYRVIDYNRDEPRWGDNLQQHLTQFLKETVADPIVSVPPMFVKLVPSQAPEESEVKVRVEMLERRLEFVEEHTGTGVELQYRQGRTGKLWTEMQRILSDGHPINELVGIVRELANRGIPKVKLLNELEFGLESEELGLVLAQLPQLNSIRGSL